MSDIVENLRRVRSSVPGGVELIAVSKFHPVPVLKEAYDAGQRLFGENRPQELHEKALQLPSDIRWHFIGHLQTNKIKLVLPYAFMVQSIDSEHLLRAVDEWGRSNSKKIRCLLELHLGAEETKHGFSEEEIRGILDHAADYGSIVFCGLMGMATNTPDEAVIRADFARISAFEVALQKEYTALTEFRELSIGMSQDYKIALEYGATMVRVGTAIFGPREY